LKEEIGKAKRGIRFALLFTALMWIIKVYENVSSASLGSYGILPRTLKGTIGIITAPLIHEDIYHLISNTFPIVILIIGVFYFYHRIAPWVFFLIYFITGFWVWIAARDAYHIGASGLVYGLISFLLFSGFLRKDARTLAVSFVVLILYGSNMIYGLVPGNENVSWESHLLGAIAGLFCAIYFKPKTKRHSIPLEPVEVVDISNNDGFFYSDKPPNVKYHFKEEKKKKHYTYDINRRNSQMGG